jgi:hypothetical protein
MEKPKRSRDKNSYSILTESTVTFEEIFSVITAVSWGSNENFSPFHHLTFV